MAHFSVACDSCSPFGVLSIRCAVYSPLGVLALGWDVWFVVSEVSVLLLFLGAWCLNAILGGEGIALLVCSLYTGCCISERLRCYLLLGMSMMLVLFAWRR